MKHVTATFAIAALAVAATFQSAHGQRGPRGPQGMERAGGVELAIRLADELELSSEQRSQLETLRQDLLAERQAAMTESLTLMSEVQAGIREPEALRQMRQDRMEHRRERGDEIRDAIQSVLTEDQVEQLRSMSRPAMGRGRMGHGRSMRDGWGPRQGRGYQGRSFRRRPGGV